MSLISNIDKKREELGLPPFLMIIPFLLLQCNEFFIEYPISYVLLIQYGSYGLKRIKNGK